jgi:hypothetical protein
MMSPGKKQTFSSFVGVGASGGASNRIDAADQRIIGGMDVYVSDFGEMAVVPNRFQRSSVLPERGCFNLRRRATRNHR